MCIFTSRYRPSTRWRRVIGFLKDKSATAMARCGGTKETSVAKAAGLWRRFYPARFVSRLGIVNYWLLRCAYANASYTLRACFKNGKPLKDLPFCAVGFAAHSIFETRSSCFLDLSHNQDNTYLPCTFFPALHGLMSKTE